MTWAEQLQKILIDKTTYTNISSYETYANVEGMTPPTNGAPAIFLERPIEFGREDKSMILHFPIDCLCYDQGDVEDMIMKLFLSSSELNGWNKDVDTIDGVADLTAYPFFISVTLEGYHHLDSLYQAWLSVEARWHIT